MAHKDQKDDKQSKGKPKTGKGKDSALTAVAASPTELKKSKLKPYPLPVARKCPMNCVSDFQDKLYGKGIRLHNPAKKMTALRCTVCNHDLG